MKCFRCGIVGHIKQNCVTILHECKVRKANSKLPEHYGKTVIKNSSCYAHKKSVHDKLAVSQQKYPERSSKSFRSGTHVGEFVMDYQSRKCNFDSGKKKAQKFNGVKKHCVTHSPRLLLTYSYPQMSLPVMLVLEL